MLVPWGQDTLGHPSREPRAAPALPCSQTLHQTCSILCPSQRLLRAQGLLHGEGKKAAGSGMWGFISFYPSTFEKIIVQVST